jgi:hypothetical protein
MRLLVVGRLSGQLAAAVKMAMAHGAKVSHVERGDQTRRRNSSGAGRGLTCSWSITTSISGR